MKTAPPAPQKRRRVSGETWQALRSAYIVGGGLRALAREAGISEGTILCRAAKEGWTAQRQEALRRARGSDAQHNGSEAAIEPQQSLTITAKALQDAHLQNMLNVAHRLSNHATAMPTPEAFESVRQIDVLDRMARRQLGLDDRRPIAQINFWQSPAFRRVDQPLPFEVEVVELQEGEEGISEGSENDSSGNGL